jgi:4-hydroxy-2-oxoheptanedioate aldolase
MRPSRIKAKFRANEPALVVCLHLLDGCLYELTSLMGFDGIWMDLEHHPTSLETATTLMRAARVGSTDIVARPARGEFPRLSRLLEAGAQAIMYPRCESAAEAEEVVRWAKFAPQGTRGADGANPDGLYCSLPRDHYLRRANEETVVIIQIETPGALDAAEAIARVPGVDALMLGPGDLSVLCGVPFSFDSPLVRDAASRVAAAAAAAGIHWGMPSPGIEHSRMLIERGARFLCHGADILMVKAGLEAIRREYAGLGITFDDRIGEMIARSAAPASK